MAYLVLALVAGLYFLISGKVKYGKTLYLEGTKARIAGLIFLAPVGLIFLLTIFVIVFSAIGINISESSSDLIDKFASTFVQNGFLIGLAYINFYSASRETKEQGGCLKYWLAYAIVISLLVIWFVPNLISNTNSYKTAAIGISILQIISIIGIWFWKKWGVFGYAATNLVSPIIAFLRVDAFSDSVVSLVQGLSLILVLYLLVKPKWQFFE
jgi:hypothetical protein